MHNGVENFEYDMPLLSTKQIITARGAWLEDVGEEFPELVRCPIAGDDRTYAGSFFLDSSSTTSEGEMEAVHVSTQMDVARWPSFLELLRDRCERLDILLRAERKDRGEPTELK